MVIVRAPLRISFGGGGTDLEAYYAHFGGFVVSASISRYCYAVVNTRTDTCIRISSADYHIWESLTLGQQITIASPLAHPKAVVSRFSESAALKGGLDLFTATEVAPGTGLGSSSALTVALVHALSVLTGGEMKHEDIAELACSIEIEDLQMSIGKQDQYASAMGGINAITFSTRGVQVTPLSLPADIVSSLNTRLLLFSTNLTHDSSELLKQQSENTQHQPKTVDTLHRMKELAYVMRDVLQAGELDQFGHLLDQVWQEKRGLSASVSSSAIDQYYQAARNAGALGGKLTGAGGGGFLLLYCPLSSQQAVREVMSRLGLHEMPFDFDFSGSTVTVYSTRTTG